MWKVDASRVFEALGLLWKVDNLRGFKVSSQLLKANALGVFSNEPCIVPILDKVEKKKLKTTFDSL